jgi:hypothetical protein
MPGATFRFHEALDDFLPASRRRRGFSTPLTGQATVKQANEALGIPRTEVELILVDGRSVNFGHRLEGDEQVSVHPEFEAQDLTPPLRARPAPWRDARFVADAHLGGLVPVLVSLFMSALSTASASGPPQSPRAFPVYGTAVEARSVAAGQFGAHPVAILSRAEIDLAPVCVPTDAPVVVEIVMPSGQRAWIPADDLPARSLAGCPPAQR